LKHNHRSFSETYALAQAQRAQCKEILLSHLFHRPDNADGIAGVSQAMSLFSDDVANAALSELRKDRLLTITARLTPEGAEAAAVVVQAQTNKEKLDELVEILSRRPELLGRVSAALADDEGVQS
jgi:hypothetical protein